MISGQLMETCQSQSMRQCQCLPPQNVSIPPKNVRIPHLNVSSPPCPATTPYIPPSREKMIFLNLIPHLNVIPPPNVRLSISGESLHLSPQIRKDSPPGERPSLAERDQKELERQ